MSPPGPALQEEWERQLLLRLRDGDQEAFGELLRRYQKRVFGLVRRIVGRPAEAEEVTQEAFLQAFRARDRFDTTRPFRPWLFKVAVNVCRNHLRAGARREQARDLSEDLGGDARALWVEAGASPESLVASTEAARRVEALLAHLTPSDREILLLRFHEDLTYAELRQIYRVPETVLKMRVHRALGRLRQHAAGGLQ